MPRQKKPKAGDCEPDASLQQSQPPAKQLTSEQVFQELRRKANRGDRDARQRLIRFLKANPWLFKKFGDMADYAENALIEAATGKEWITRQAVKYEVNAMRKSLAGVRPTQLEIMGVDRLIAAWLLLQHVQMQAVQPHPERGWAAFWMRKLESAEKMYRMALASLTMIRTLLPASAQPANTPAVVDAGGQAAMPESKEPIELPVPENIATDAPWVNRIAGLMPHPEGAESNHVNGSGKLNGHRRLEELLEPCGG